jgi:tetraacyldisaccharide 4'-kinase
MGVFDADWAQIHQERHIRIGSLPLVLSSLLYGAGVNSRLWAYGKGVFKRKTLPGFVVSIGNLTAGGTGKTPATALVAEWARTEGYRVAVLSRGYGGTPSRDVLVVSDETGVQSTLRETGDEPLLLAQRLPRIPVVISKKRYRAGMLARERFGSDFFVLDDGFQHLELHRDLDVALIDEQDPFGNARLLPWGPLREPIGQLDRADAIVLTRCKPHDCGMSTQEVLNERFPRVPVWPATHMPEQVVFPGSGKAHDPAFLKGKRIAAFAGIARPEVFRNTLTSLGAEVLAFRRFRDHYQFGPEDLQHLLRMKEDLGAHFLVTTEKDWMRLAPLMREVADLAYLTVRFALVKGEKEFFDLVRSRIGQPHRSA